MAHAIPHEPRASPLTPRNLDSPSTLLAAAVNSQKDPHAAKASGTDANSKLLSSGLSSDGAAGGAGCVSRGRFPTLSGRNTPSRSSSDDSPAAEDGTRSLSAHGQSMYISGQSAQQFSVTGHEHQVDYEKLAMLAQIRDLEGLLAKRDVVIYKAREKISQLLAKLRRRDELISALQFTINSGARPSAPNASPVPSVPVQRADVFKQLNVELQRMRRTRSEMQDDLEACQIQMRDLEAAFSRRSAAEQSDSNEQNKHFEQVSSLAALISDRHRFLVTYRSKLAELEAEFAKIEPQEAASGSAGGKSRGESRSHSQWRESDAGSRSSSHGDDDECDEERG